ncbi:hypothetical protein GDO78_011446 [Eleutherodactylus coqui]|uniref:Uncharacterized protein n=1 Tax=Eleutherodactylus coqui TaxID=57060 RepID=A0A8J6F8X9_ELECQ|nr:hypothetical protein GDO78_011446 [Eleutherodactylus coqui]
MADAPSLPDRAEQDQWCFSLHRRPYVQDGGSAQRRTSPETALYPSVLLFAARPQGNSSPSSQGPLVFSSPSLLLPGSYFTLPHSLCIFLWGGSWHRRVGTMGGAVLKLLKRQGGCCSLF